MLSVQEKKEFERIIQSNKHEIYVVSFEEMDAVIKSSPKGTKQSVQEIWQDLKSKAGLGVSYYASADDAVKMTKLVADLGGIGARVYIKNYAGKPHIILKGRPGLRTIFTGTKYGIKNPKVVSMGLGKAGAIAATKQGGIVTVILLTIYRVVDFFLSDESTLSRLVGTLATDIVKVGITTAASIGGAVIMGGFTLAVGPILAVIVVGIGVSVLLEYVDNSLGITNRVISGLDELGDGAESFIVAQKKQVRKVVDRTVNQVIDHAIESAQALAINWVQRTLKEYLSTSRRIW
ncbi:MAG: hypothetical protein JKY50_11890 [Oleispira sp.]|nr:hypothetical protein [Oleispira sp.]MBL4881127.1 hypothetical protein [Oleispira sp.]